ncbi:GNAT family N-acetyltransferase [Enterococcus faecalis]|uniref:GNAT family N-acetyltransferase n=1 Tax=Enterococcus faecalis TaxID=1351 RepID=UPI0020905568|nr:N-acetyltransferase [Enterococcus faecalis]MCO5487001.1 GNAT family N-acetyltransferase [Enterococcus faecalis]HDT8178231.1 GNAT family N-acetyltransferase [Enterococcus faecalis]HDV0788975.1 GNAT family N-acetyltransferase [Enterococcus faecalis]
MSVFIRECTVADVPELEAICQETFADTYGDGENEEDLQAHYERKFSPAVLESEILHKDSQYFFAFYNNELAGYVKLNHGDAQISYQHPQALQVERIYIRKSFKRLGLGKHLITKAIELAEEAEKETVWLGVWEHNHPAQKFYQSLGFVKTDEHDFYMGNERHTDYTMTKQLKEST